MIISLFVVYHKNPTFCFFCGSKGLLFMDVFIDDEKNREKQGIIRKASFSPLAQYVNKECTPRTPQSFQIINR